MEWLRNNKNLILAEGILFTLLGFLAIAMPGISTLSTELFIGWLLIFGGAVQMYRTFQSRREGSFVGSFLLSIMYLLFGILLLIFPVAGIFSLTILLIAFFIAEGISKFILGIQLRASNQWGWFLFSGAISLIMAFIIWSGWPGTAFWVIGLLVGINMIFFGVSLILLSRGIPKDPNTPDSFSNP